MRLAGQGRLFSVGLGFGLPTFMVAVTEEARQMVEPKRNGLLTALKRRKIFFLWLLCLHSNIWKSSVIAFDFVFVS